MAKVPETGDWVTFPLEQHQVIQLEWYDKTAQTARYYVDKCWFGSRISHTKCKEGLNPIGETVIFIAAEYIETRMQGAPHLKQYHLADRMRTLVRKEYSASEADSTWGLFQLDKSFQYGQNDKQTFRWIVYHPPVFKDHPRRMFQHRFTDNLLTQAVIDTIGGIAGGLGGIAGGGGGLKDGSTTLMRRIVGLFAMKVGDALHDFDEDTSNDLHPLPAEPQRGRSGSGSGSKERYQSRSESPSQAKTRKNRSETSEEKKPQTMSPTKQQQERAQSTKKVQRGVLDLKSKVKETPSQPLHSPGPDKAPKIANYTNIKQINIKGRSNNIK